MQGEPPPRVLASPRQLETAQDLLAGIRTGPSRRTLNLREGRGEVELVRLDRQVTLTVLADSGSPEAFSAALDHDGLGGLVADRIVEVSTWDDFRGDGLEDRFPLLSVPSYAETRSMIETMRRKGGEFSVWETNSTAPVLKAWTTERELMVSRPGSSSISAGPGTDMRSTDGLHSALEEVCALPGDRLEARATFLFWFAQRVASPGPDGPVQRAERRRWLRRRSD